jgi:hypothetical protein
VDALISAPALACPHRVSHHWEHQVPKPAFERGAARHAVQLPQRRHKNLIEDVFDVHLTGLQVSQRLMVSDLARHKPLQGGEMLFGQGNKSFPVAGLGSLEGDGVRLHCGCLGSHGSGSLILPVGVYRCSRRRSSRGHFSRT